MNDTMNLISFMGIVYFSRSVIISGLHFIEDAALVALGRYTEINYLMLLTGTVLFGVLLAWIARMPKVKKWLGTD